MHESLDLTGPGARLARRLNEAENAHDLDAIEALQHPEMEVTQNGKPMIASSTEDREYNSRLLAMYPDYHRELLHVVENGAITCLTWQMHGTAAAEFPDAPPLTATGCSVIEVEDDQIRRAWLYLDPTSLAAVLAPK